MKKGTLSTIILIILLCVGLALLLYPSISDYWNAKHSARVISSYKQTVDTMDDAAYKTMWQSAQDYNDKLNARDNVFALSEGLGAEYKAQLDPDGNGIMGYVEIDKIDVYLPIYHGTAENELQSGVGHLEWTSLPVGGEGTHCVISGHRGLPSARLFSDLDALVEGDTFRLCILDQTLTYEVDQIRIVLPEETSNLVPEQGKDYCTLVTCTPYGVNTHRLLIRGHRVENERTSDINVISEAVIVEPLIVAPIIAVPILLTVLAAFSFMPSRKRKK